MAIVPYTSSHLAAKRIRENQRKRAEYDSDISFTLKEREYLDNSIQKNDLYIDIILYGSLILVLLFMILLGIDSIFKTGIILEPLYPDVKIK